MKRAAALSAVLVILLTAMGCVAGPSRPRRSVGQFGDMIRQHVQREALLYNSYGNFCGTTYNYNATPVDETDQCCLDHDLCYYASRSAECVDSWLGPYFTRYTWDHVNDTVICDDEEGTCHRTLCDCDKATVECFLLHPYTDEHKRSSFWDIFA